MHRPLITKPRLTLFATALGFGLVTGNAHAAPIITLPDPGTSIDGIPTTIQYDDFFSYSAGLLEAWRDAGLIPSSFGPYDFATGTGLNELLVYTGAGGATNEAGISDPLDAPGGGTDAFAGEWGQNDGETVTVGEVLAFLQSIDPSLNSPVFYFDHNQTGNEPDLMASGSIRIVDPDTNMLLAEFCFDGTIDDMCDLDDMVLSPGLIEETGTSGTTYEANNNAGSGKPDFFITPIGLNLEDFDANALFLVDIRLGLLNNGFEELAIIGASVNGTTIPVPASALLFATGLLGLGLTKRRHKKELT